jgi:hypothetical protein
MLVQNFFPERTRQLTSDLVPYLKTSSNVLHAWTSSACTLMHARLDSVPEMEMYDDVHSPVHNFEITYVVDAQGS